MDAKTIAYILDHSEAKVLVVDRQLHVEVKKALSTLKNKITIIDINDKYADQSKLEKIGDLEYEEFLNTGDENYPWKMPEDEWQAISLSYTWNDVYKRCLKFASALEKIGIKKGDTVSFLAFNTPEIFEAHYSVPMTGGVLNTINIRLDAKTIAYILDHSDAKVLVVDLSLIHI